MEWLRNIFCNRCPLHLKVKSYEAEINRLAKENAIQEQDIKFLENQLIDCKQQISSLVKQIERLKKENKHLKKLVSIRKTYKRVRRKNNMVVCNESEDRD
jgi:regulator of replication initiation timing